MRKLLLALFLFCGCATTTVKKTESAIVADLGQCKPEETELVHNALPLVADYAICLAMNSNNTDACSAQRNAMLNSAKDSAVACGLGLIARADQAAHAQVDASAGN